MIRLFLRLFLYSVSLFLGPLVCIADSGTAQGQIVFLDSNELPSIVNIPSLEAVRPVNLDLGEWSQRFTVIMPEFNAAKWHDLKARQRQTRCFSVGNEGPHLDFVDWKKQITGWKEMKRFPDSKWVSASFGESEFGAVPVISNDEIETQVRDALKDSPQGLEQWLTVARECAKKPGNCLGDCWTEVQFFRQANGIEEIITTIRLAIPMGC